MIFSMIGFVEVKLGVHHIVRHLEMVVGSKAVEATSTEIFFKDSPCVYTINSHFSAFN